MDIKPKICVKCKKSSDNTSFQILTAKNGSKYYRSRCDDCINARNAICRNKKTKSIPKEKIKFDYDNKITYNPKKKEIFIRKRHIGRIPVDKIKYSHNKKIVYNPEPVRRYVGRIPLEKVGYAEPEEIVYNVGFISDKPVVKSIPPKKIKYDYDTLPVYNNPATEKPKKEAIPARKIKYNYESNVIYNNPDTEDKSVKSIPSRKIKYNHIHKVKRDPLIEIPKEVQDRKSVV